MGCNSSTQVSVKNNGTSAPTDKPVLAAPPAPDVPAAPAKQPDPPVDKLPNGTATDTNRPPTPKNEQHTLSAGADDGSGEHHDSASPPRNTESDQIEQGTCMAEKTASRPSSAQNALKAVENTCPAVADSMAQEPVLEFKPDENNNEVVAEAPVQSSNEQSNDVEEVPAKPASRPPSRPPSAKAEVQEQPPAPAEEPPMLELAETEPEPALAEPAPELEPELAPEQPAEAETTAPVDPPAESSEPAPADTAETAPAASEENAA